MARRIIILMLMLAVAAAGLPGPATAAGRSEGDIAKVAIGAYRDGFYDVAREELEDFLHRYPTSPYAGQIKLVLYLTYLHLGSCQAAGKIWPQINQPAELQKSGFSPSQLLLQLGLCFYRHDDAANARVYLEKILAAYPLAPQADLARFYLGKMAFASERWRQAREQLEKLLAKKDAVLTKAYRQELLYMAAICRYRLADYREALPLLDDFYRRYGQQLEPAGRCFFCQAITDAALKTGRLPRARQAVARWEQECPRAPALNKALLLLGEAFYRQQQWESAAAPLRRLLARPGVEPETRIRVYGYLVNISIKTRRPEQAAAYLEKLLPLTRGQAAYARNLRLLARLYADRGDWRRCRRTLERFFAAYPEEDDFKLLLLYGQAASRTSSCAAFCRFLASRVDLERLDYRDHFQVDVVRQYASCLEKTGNYRQAFLALGRLYAHESRRPARIMLLAALNRLALQGRQSASLSWVADQVIENFPLDDADCEALLQRYPLLVLTVADQFYQRQQYGQALPSLLWLQSLPPARTTAFIAKVRLLLAECYWRLHKDENAIPLYELLLNGENPEYRELSGLRLLAIYQRLGYREKRARALQRLLAVARDPALRRQLRRELAAGKKKP